MAAAPRREFVVTHEFLLIWQNAELEQRAISGLKSTGGAQSGKWRSWLGFGEHDIHYIFKSPLLQSV